MSDKNINDINTLLKYIENTLGCNSECQRERDIERLRKKWKDSESKLKTLPDLVQTNERNFFVAKNGEDYYRDNILRKRYINIINKWKEDQLAKFNEVNILMETMLQNFQSETFAKSRLDQLYNEVVERNKQLKQDIDYYKRETLTSQRRVWYQIEENDSVYSWRFYIKIVYYAIALAYVLFGEFFREGQYKNWRIWLLLILYLSIPYILNYIISGIIYIYDYYSNLAPN